MAKGFWNKLADKLRRPSDMVRQVRRLAGLRSRLDGDFMDELEEILHLADLGVETVDRVIGHIRKDPRSHNESKPEVIVDLLYEAMYDVIQRDQARLEFDRGQPHVIVVVGVNGAGKTTTIGKLAQQLRDDGKKVVMIAADTFRAAAIEQLTIWSERTGATIFTKPEGSDPASVCFEGLTSDAAKEADVVLIDTAGRLHTKDDLMGELDKIVRVIKKAQPDAPHETLLTLDATTGQNAVQQAKIFTEIVGVTGLIMTKYDGTARGGIILAVCDKFNLPLYKVGVGEGAEDLRDFDAKEFVDALFAEEA